MRLKKIKLAGFKSFVDPTTVELPSQLASIVGPNGCGKSNIIDAVRWVMGESSAKNLRGESITDVIFSGSSVRKPVGQAMIELIFDNSQGKLVGPYANYNEISIKRTVNREAQSTYFLNGTKCRKRDIADVFLGTGLGPRSYSIIEQGMISRVIEAKPEELRVHLEEAAGISKYKERRKETERRIRHTRENLERLSDVREELGKQLSRLHQQAQAAEKYQNFKKEERQVKGQLYIQRWKVLQDQHDQEQQKIQDYEIAVEKQRAQQQQIDVSLEKERLAFSEVSEKLHACQADYYQAGNEVTRLEQQIEHATARIRETGQEMTRLNESLEKARLELTADEEQKVLLAEQEEELAPEIELLQTAVEEATLLAEEEEVNYRQLEKERETLLQQVALCRQEAEVEQTRIRHMEEQGQRLQQRLEKLRTETENSDLATLEAGLTEVQEEQRELEEKEQELQLQYEEQQIALSHQRQQLEHQRQELEQQRGQLHPLKGRLASLEALQQAALAESSEHVQEWIHAQGLAESKQLAQSIRVQEGWETAVETVLGESLQALYTPDYQVNSSLSELEASLICIDQSVRFNDDASLGSSSDQSIQALKLINVVEHAESLPSELQHVYLADDLLTALRIRLALKSYESVVTKEGLWFGANWLKVTKRDDAHSGVIAREKELESLKQQELTLEENIAINEERLSQTQHNLQLAEEQVKTAQQHMQVTQRELAEIKARVSGRLARIEQLRARLAVVQHELTEAQELFTEEQEEIKIARQRLEVAVEQMAELELQRQGLESGRVDSQRKTQEARQQLESLKGQFQQKQMQLQRVQSEQAGIKAALERLEELLGRDKLRLAELEKSRALFEEPLEEQRMLLDEQLERQLGFEDRLTIAKEQSQGHENQVRVLEKQLHAQMNQVASAREALEKGRLQTQELFIRRQSIEEQLVEAGFQLRGLLEIYDESGDVKELEESLELIGRRIQRLGVINLAAIDEYAAQSERKVYLDAQHDDLIEALETLEAAIRKIDKETRTRFKETFDEVNGHFKTLFPKLFGGGGATLELIGDDLLEAGVALMAHPPGKRNSTIHLLSGGEKALTAAALVFAIFQLNPAPFCMLDEVDAPLDDANVGRFCRLVEEMSETVQFIFISHNKIAMEMADQLVGVTMREPGVSRLVAVDIEKALEMAEE
ncbi:chromosome segregation protein SMC [Piscirickettsia litoralis]|uniref:Chromosome partition protein Smc n=1 Tax=Piscirickettsia litoralis TaxID=1891921 RepID=A0ABX3A067_9GAMM|nr:chromosome segregation protein SMC [Piscirickettsia litoralis]ODN42252.1 chromosome segregation protein SMC [Piscirickettsia litoralis]